MSCPFKSEEHTDHLLAYSAGKLRGEAVAQLELHMRSCEECAAVGKAQADVWKLLDNWDVRPVSADFNRQLYARIDAAAQASWLERFAASMNEFLRPVFARPAFALTAASLVIVGGFVLDHPGRPSALRASTAETNKIHLNKAEADQVEATLDDIDILRQFDPKPDDTAKDAASKSM